MCICGRESRSADQNTYKHKLETEIDIASMELHAREPQESKLNGNHTNLLCPCVFQLLTSLPTVCVHVSSSCDVAGAIATAAYAAGQLNNNDTMTADSGGSTPSAASSTASSNGLVAALAQLRLTMGTAAPSSLSLLLEPAFFPQAGQRKLVALADCKFLKA